MSAAQIPLWENPVWDRPPVNRDFIEEMEWWIAQGKNHATHFHWSDDRHDAADSILQIRAELFTRGWRWNEAEKHMERDGWYVWFRSQGVLAPPIAQWNTLAWKAEFLAKLEAKKVTD